MNRRAARIMPAVLILASGCATAATTPSVPAEETPRESASASTSTEPSPSASAPAPTIVTGPPEISWSEVPVDGFFADVIGEGSRFVAVGVGSDGTAAWTSVDGQTWEEEPVPDFPVVEPEPGVSVDAVMGTLVRLDDTVYSFGTVYFIDAPYFTGWRRTDGESWQRIESDNPFFDAGALTAVTAGDHALVAVMSAPYAFGNAIWRWRADTSWVAATLDAEAGEENRVGEVAWSGGTFLAVGHTAVPDREIAIDAWPQTPAMWRSSDGLEWMAATPPSEASTICALDALPDDEGFVVVGFSDEGLAAWKSADGAAWTRGTLEAPTGFDLATLDPDGVRCDLAPIGHGMLATITGSDTLVSWTSIDGRTWSISDQRKLPFASLGRVATAGDTAVVVVTTFDAATSTDNQVILLGRMEP
jgi:hypothetical protein